MKKILLLSLIMITALACSSDDSSENQPKNELDILIENGPWIYNRVEILEIEENGTPPTTDEAARAEINSHNEGLIIEYRKDGTVQQTINGEVSQFNYEYDQETNSIIYEGDFAVSRNVNISNLEFSVELTYLIENEEGTEDDAIAKSRLFFIKIQ